MTPDEFHMARRRLKLTQSALGKLLGLSVVTIGRYESGRSTIPNVVALAMRAIEEKRV